MLDVIMLGVIMLVVIKLGVITLGVLGPSEPAVSDEEEQNEF